jgi:hypothetical protein
MMHHTFLTIIFEKVAKFDLSCMSSKGYPRRPSIICNMVRTSNLKRGVNGYK